MCEKKKHYFKYSLSDIANWESDIDNSVQVPILQRGLVWNARRMEFLWDSLMRQIPIGSFIVINGLKGQSKDGNESGDVYYLIDGQQRANAISLAFKPFDEKNGEYPVLWIDINPNDETNKSEIKKKFIFKITTKAHPWGFKASSDDSPSNSKLSFSDITTNVKKKILNERPAPYNLFPFKAQLPVPFFYLVKNRNIETCDEFWNKVICDITNDNSDWKGIFIESIRTFGNSEVEADKIKRELIYKAVRQIDNTRVFALVAPEELTNTDETNELEESGLSTLFERINTLGVKPTNEELLYSVLKSFAPEVHSIDTIAAKKMFPYRMLMLALRTYFTINEGIIPNSKGFKKSVTIGNIKKLVNSEKEAMIKFINNEFVKLVYKVDKWLGFNDKDENLETWGVLKFHRTSIAQYSIDIYQLLLILAELDKNENKLEGKQISALATYLHWFYIDKQKCVETIYMCIKNSEKPLFEKIQQGIAEAISKKFLFPPVYPKRLEALMCNAIDEKDYFQSFISKYEYSNAIFRIWHWRRKESCELLLYSVKDFMQGHFKDYNPADREMWEEHNRPWDYDHIFPTSWHYNKKSGKFRVPCADYADSIGNIAPISFSQNRKKNANKPTADYCDADPRLLIEYDKIKDFAQDAIHDESKANTFITTTINRFIKVYKKWFNDLEIAKLFERDELDGNIGKRKKIFKTIKNELSECNYYIYESGKDFILEDEHSVDTVFFAEWLTVGKLIKDKYFVCATADCDTVTIGVRKYPARQTLGDNDKGILGNIVNSPSIYKYIDNKWWHISSEIKMESENIIDTCLNEIKELITKLEKSGA